MTINYKPKMIYRNLYHKGVDLSSHKDGACQFRDIFAKVMATGKTDLSKSYYNPIRKMWVTTHVSEIIKQPYPKKSFKIQRMYGNFFPKLSSIISEKCVVTHNFLFGF